MRICVFLRVVKFKLFGARLPLKTRIYGHVEIIGYYSNLEIGSGVVLNHGVILNTRNRIKIGENVHISSCAKIYTGKLDIKTMKDHHSAPVEIGKNVWIGSGAICLGGISIADNSVIGAGSVVTKSIEKPGLYAGVPAKFVRSV